MSDAEKKDHSTKDGAGFKVSDRRKFSTDGELLSTENDSSDSVEPDSEAAGKIESEPKTDDPSAQDQEGEIDFSSFILSLATTALAHLGEVPDPATGEKTENLGAAKQMIDILSILKTKTEGNLENDEARLLESLLYELRMRYLNSAKIISG